MIKRTLRKNIYREIRGTLNRFIAIFAITALGAGFYAGLKATGPNMEATADQYYQEQQLMDWRLLSTMGFTEDDVSALKQQNTTGHVMAGYGADMLLDVADGTEVVRLHSLPEDLSENNSNYLNRLVLTEGELPAAPNECVVDSAAGRSVGDVIELSALNDEAALERMAEHAFTVVGLVKSPEYIAFQRGNTTVGNGRLSFFMYLPATAFNSEVYTEVFLRAEESDHVSSFSEAYDQLEQDGTAQLETFGEERAQIRYDDIYSEGEQKLDEVRQELADAEQQANTALSEAWQQILDGQARLASARAELQAGEQQWNEGQRAIQSAEATLATSRRQLVEGDASYQQQLSLYETKQQEYEGYVTLLNEQKTLYSTAVAQLEGLKQGVAQLETAAAGLARLQELIESGAPPEVVQAAVTEFKSTATATAGAIQQLAVAINQMGMPDQSAALQTAALQITASAEADDYGAATAVAAGIPALLQPYMQQAQQELDANGELIQQKQNELEQGKTELDTAGQQLAAARQTLDAGWVQLTDGENQLAARKQQLGAAQTQLNNARASLLQGEADLANGQAEYEQNKMEAEEEFAKARADIADGQQTLDELEKPEWYVFNRHENAGYSGFSSDADRIDAIAVVIPVFFFLVAALVCLTTMTRMVEEQRTQIGTFKALGFSKPSIAFKYLLYAGMASTAGGIAGVLLGLSIFPPAVWDAYRMMYLMPNIVQANNTWLAVASVAASVLCTTLATLAACLGELRSVPAELMRPKAPRAGKRVLLERVTPLWNRLGFNWKVTVRNLFRYKKRFFMTIIGVAGCSALLLTGFGLRDSINGLVDRQFGSISLYHMAANLTAPSSSKANTELNEILPSLGKSLYVGQITIDAQKDNRTNAGMTTYLYIPEETAQLPQFINLHNRKTGDTVVLPDTANGVVITEKLAGKLDVEVGDSIEIGRPNETKVEATVTGIVENYIYNYVYIAPDVFSDLFGEAPEYNMLLLRMPENAELNGQNTLSTLVDSDGVASALNVEQLSSHLDDLMQSLNSVIWLILISAATLAFVVLYNLTNINITERSREIATLKVLGFYPSEVAGYIYREGLLLTLIGIAAGLVLGIFLHGFVITTAEVDEIMFRRTIQPLSYLWAALFTLLSAGLVDLVMLKRLRKVDMIESLKSAE